MTTGVLLNMHANCCKGSCTDRDASLRPASGTSKH